MSKLDKFVNVRYERKISSFSDIDFDTVVVLSTTVIGSPNTPDLMVSPSAFPKTMPYVLADVGKRALEHGKRVCFTNKFIENKYVYLLADNDSDLIAKLINFPVGDRYDKFIFVTTEEIWNNKFEFADCETGLFENYSDYGKRIVLAKNVEIAASVAGVIAGGYRNFTTHLRQIMSTLELRQRNNPSSNPVQDRSLGSVKLAGNYFIEGSMTAGSYRMSIKYDQKEDPISIQLLLNELSGRTLEYDILPEESNGVLTHRTIVMNEMFDFNYALLNALEANENYDETIEGSEKYVRKYNTIDEMLIDLLTETSGKYFKIKSILQKSLSKSDEESEEGYKSRLKEYEDNVQQYYDDRVFVDRTVLEDRLQLRLQEECMRALTYKDGVPFTETGVNIVAASGAIALTEAVGLNIIDDYETDTNYDQVTNENIEKRVYNKLVYRFRFAGSIEYVEVVLEV